MADPISDEIRGIKARVDKLEAARKPDQISDHIKKELSEIF